MHHYSNEGWTTLESALSFVNFCVCFIATFTAMFLLQEEISDAESGSTCR